jgi:fatty acid desaturase
MREQAVTPAGVALAELGHVPNVEWPTLGLAAGIYGGWLALTYWHAALPAWLICLALAWLVAWHGSLQHEVLHGHPTRVRAINDAIGFPPLALWLPYRLYRASHLRHHIDWRLTDPLDDPESAYWTAEQWTTLSTPARLLVRLQGCFLGRILVGPAWAIARFYYFQARSAWHDFGAARRIWAAHLLGVIAVLTWVIGVCRFDPLLYVLGVVYPATSLMLVRSYAEHRAAPGVVERIAIVEGSRVLGLLFLYNNLHVVHHAWPRLPWYRIPQVYRRHRETFVAVNGGLVYRGYADVLRRFLLAPHDSLLHPFGRIPEESLPS